MPRAKKTVAKLVPHVEETVDTEALKEVPAVEDEYPEEVPEAPNEAPKDEFADVPETEEHVPQGYYRNELVVRKGNRIMNGRLYVEVETVTATYLITEAEYETEVIFK